MARPLIVYADLQITHGNEVVRVNGRGDRIEVYHPSILFFFKALKGSYPIKRKFLVYIDQLLQRLDLTVVLKTKYFCFSLLGVSATKWVKLALRFFLPN
jgi:hypothetical protein